MPAFRARGIVWQAPLVVVWIACTALHVKQLAGGHLAWVGVYVVSPSDRDGFPAVRGFWPFAGFCLY